MIAAILATLIIILGVGLIWGMTFVLERYPNTLYVFIAILVMGIWIPIYGMVKIWLGK